MNLWVVKIPNEPVGIAPHICPINRGPSTEVFSMALYGAMGNLTACCSNFWISLTCKEMSRCAKPFPLPFSCPAKPGGELEKDLRLRKASLFSWQTQIIGRINHFLNQQPIILGYMFIYIMEIPDLSIHLMFTQPHKTKPLWLLSTRRSSPDSSVSPQLEIRWTPLAIAEFLVLLITPQFLLAKEPGTWITSMLFCW